MILIRFLGENNIVKLTLIGTNLVFILSDLNQINKINDKLILILIIRFIYFSYPAHKINILQNLILPSSLIVVKNYASIYLNQSLS